MLLLSLFQIGNIFGDFEIILKIVGLLFIYSFVKSHIQHPVLSLVLIVGLSGFLLFDVWKIFGSALILYLIVIYGFAHILVDLSFLNAFGGHEHVDSHQTQGRKELHHQARRMLFGMRGGGKQ